MLIIQLRKYASSELFAHVSIPQAVTFIYEGLKFKITLNQGSPIGLLICDHN